MEQLFESLSKTDVDGATFRVIEQNEYRWSNFSSH